MPVEKIGKQGGSYKCRHGVVRRPFNQNIANAYYLAGFIEHVGSDCKRILES